MRITADEYWRTRADVAPTRLITTNDVLREAFLFGATEAEVVAEAGDYTLRVAGLRVVDRWRLRRRLQDEAPLGTRVAVEKLKGRDHGEEED
jgi:hypothetical protein